MPRERQCQRHGAGPCSCEMGNIYRFVEPIAMVCLAEMGQAHGYQIASAASNYSVTHAGVDIPAVYRTLRRLEAMGHVQSEWDTKGGGPARRTYSLTATGWRHLKEWAVVLGDVTASLSRISSQIASIVGKAEK